MAVAAAVGGWWSCFWRAHFKVAVSVWVGVGFVEFLWIDEFGCKFANCLLKLLAEDGFASFCAVVVNKNEELTHA